VHEKDRQTLCDASLANKKKHILFEVKSTLSALSL
jgi:hypothetical protein